MAHYESDGRGGIVMICQACGQPCHRGRGRKKEVLDKRASTKAQKVFREEGCPQCFCHDCLQLNDDPISAAIAPHVLNQTLEKPFSLQQAIAEAAKNLGGPGSTSAALPPPADCACGRPSATRCLKCQKTFCVTCIGKHAHPEEAEESQRRMQNLLPPPEPPPRPERF